MCITYTLPSGVMYSTEHRNYTHCSTESNTPNVLADCLVQFRKKKERKEWKSSALPAWGMVTYPAAWVLYHWECICYLLGTDTEEADCSCTFKLHLTCSEGFGLQKASLCIMLHCKANTLHCSFWLPWGWGVKTGKRDNGYTCGALWALQWPPCLLTLPSLSHKSYPERFIWLSCQASPGAFGGWSRSTPKPHGDKFFICWVTTACGRLCCTTHQGSCSKCHNKSVIRMIIPPVWSRGRGWEEAYWHKDSHRKGVWDWANVFAWNARPRLYIKGNVCLCPGERVCQTKPCPHRSSSLVGCAWLPPFSQLLSAVHSITP